MATISKTGIATGQNITAAQITNIIDALDGTDTTDINIKGTLTLPNISDVSASLATALASSGTSFTAAGISGSLGTNATLIRSLTAAGISGSLGANASLIRTLTSAGISGSLGANASLIRTLTSAGISGSVVGATSLGTGAATVNIGPSAGRLTLNSTGILNTDKAYFYGNSGTGALNVGISNSDTDDANNRAFFNVDASTSLLRMRGKDASDTQVSASFTNYGTYTELTSGNVGYSFFINNSRSAGTKIGFGNSKTANDKVIVYTATNTQDLRPGTNSGAYGGLYVAHTLELGGPKGWKTTGTTWDTTSDERLKENIITASLDICYNVVKSIPLKRFNYIDNYTHHSLPDVNQLGWIAQDVSGSLPKSVQSGSFTTWSTYSGSSITASDGISIIKDGDRVQDILAGSQIIQNSLTLDADQIFKMMYGAVQKLQIKVEALEAQISGSS